MPEVRIKLDKMLKDKVFFKFILLTDFLRISFKQCDQYLFRPVGIRVNMPDLSKRVLRKLGHTLVSTRSHKSQMGLVQVTQTIYVSKYRFQQLSNMPSKVSLSLK